MDINPKKAPAVLLAVLPALLWSCGDGQVTVMQTQTETRQTTITQSTTGSSSRVKTAYKKKINDLGQRADAMNNDYRVLIERRNAGEAIRSDDLAYKAEQYANVYDDMAGELTTMDAPPEFRDAHAMFLSGFQKWQQAYEKYADGFWNNRDDSLTKASELDGQAKSEVNVAIFQINQID